MKLPPFAVHRPGSVAEASRLLTDLGDDAAAYCGGTELLLAMKLGLASYEHLVDLKRVPGLGAITNGGGTLRVGAAATHHQIETSAAVRASYPELAAMIAQVANLRVRSVGTLGGNLCFADPHSDPASFLIAVGATMVCQRADETRRIPAAEFCAGFYQTALRPGELLIAVELPPRPPRAGIAHLRMKLTERPVVTVTALISLGDSRAVCDTSLVIGSAGSVPFRAATASLIGAGPGDFGPGAQSCAEQAAADCEVLPDGECSPEYLRQLVRVYARDALAQAFAAAAHR
jgi:aerobic carbon-monoxide dehydrogenase medium subunit